MRIRFRSLLWFIPLLGIIVGLINAFGFIHGTFMPWYFVGKPSDPISKIIGIVDKNHLFVETDSGNIYSFEYNHYLRESSFLPFPIVWNKVEKQAIETDPIYKPTMNFISPPLLFKVKQQYEMAYPLVEGDQLVKFALSEDGNLWLWNYGQGGMAVLTYLMFPAIGLFYGSILAVIMRIGIFLWDRIRPPGLPY
jgi:hypothetical protein